MGLASVARGDGQDPDRLLYECLCEVLLTCDEGVENEPLLVTFAKLISERSWLCPDVGVEVDAVASVTEHGASRQGKPVGDAAWANALKLCVATVERSKLVNITNHKAGLRVVESAKEKLRVYLADEGRRQDLTALRQIIDNATSSIKLKASSQGCVMLSVAQHAATWAKLVAELDRITSSASDSF